MCCELLASRGSRLHGRLGINQEQRAHGLGVPGEKLPCMLRLPMATQGDSRVWRTELACLSHIRCMCPEPQRRPDRRCSRSASSRWGQRLGQGTPGFMPDSLAVTVPALGRRAWGSGLLPGVGIMQGNLGASLVTHTCYSSHRRAPDQPLRPQEWLVPSRGGFGTLCGPRGVPFRRLLTSGTPCVQG